MFLSIPKTVFLTKNETNITITGDTEIRNVTQTEEEKIRPYPHVLFEAGPDAESKTKYHICTHFSPKPPPQPERLETVKTLLEIFLDTLEHFGIEYWLDHGTLLGSFREKNIIPWDNDADIGITFESFTQILLQTTSPSFQWPCDDCSLIVRQGRHSHVIPFKFVNTTNGVYVDSFLFIRKDDPQWPKKGKRRLANFWPDRCHTCKDGILLIDYDLVYPLAKNCSFNDRLYFCPNKVETYLLHLYKHLRPTPPKNFKPK